MLSAHTHTLTTCGKSLRLRRSPTGLSWQMASETDHSTTTLASSALWRDDESALTLQPRALEEAACRTPYSRSAAPGNWRSGSPRTSGSWRKTLLSAQVPAGCATHATCSHARALCSTLPRRATFERQRLQKRGSRNFWARSGAATGACLTTAGRYSRGRRGLGATKEGALASSS